MKLEKGALRGIKVGAMSHPVHEIKNAKTKKETVGCCLITSTGPMFASVINRTLNTLLVDAKNRNETVNIILHS